MWPLLGASFSTSTLGWGAASGIASAAAFVLLYRTLAIGPMNVLYPVGTVLLARGVLAERIHRGRLLGLGVAAVAVSLLALL